eukprot:PhM_4_TR13055/c0_g1_i1/m.106066
MRSKPSISGGNKTKKSNNSDRPHIQWAPKLVKAERKYQKPPVQLKPQLWWRQRPTIKTVVETLVLPAGRIMQMMVADTMRISFATLREAEIAVSASDDAFAALTAENTMSNSSPAKQQQARGDSNTPVRNSAKPNKPAQGKFLKSSLAIQNPDSRTWITLCSLTSAYPNEVLPLMLPPGRYRIQAMGNAGDIEIHTTNRAMTMENM